MSEGFISRGFRRRRQQDDTSGRIPPGQYLERGFPVLSAGPTPHTPLEKWDFSIVGEVDQPKRWTWDEFRALPREKNPSLMALSPVLVSLFSCCSSLYDVQIRGEALNLRCPFPLKGFILGLSFQLPLLLSCDDHKNIDCHRNLLVSICYNSTALLLTVTLIAVVHPP